MSKFEFNENGVCVNPIREGYSSKLIEYYISLAKSSNGWVYGLSYGLYTDNYSGGSFPCSMLGKHYPTMKEARKEAIKRLDTIYQNNYIQNPEYGKELKSKLIAAYEHLREMKSNAN